MGRSEPDRITTTPSRLESAAAWANPAPARSPTQPLPAASEVDERIRRYRAEMVHQAMLFPSIYREYRRYHERRDNAESVRELQRVRLAELLRHAVTSVPAYRHLPVDPDPWAMLQRFPVVTKAELRTRLADHCDDGIEPARCRFISTSGTTGEPLRLIHDENHLVHSYALALRRVIRLGLALDRKVLHPFHTLLDRWFEYTAPAHGLARIAEFGAAGDRHYWADVVDRVRGYRPDVVVGHPSRVLELCDLLGEAGPVRPHAVMTWGERITPGMAARVGSFFGTRVIDMYGMREFGTIATRCRYDGYHVEAERLVVEVVDEAGDPVPAPQVGELVVTNLINKAMPLIRYRTGDIGSLGAAPCECGAPQHLLSVVEGREPGTIVLAGGREVPVITVLRILQAVPIERYQVIQTAPDEIVLNVKPAPGFTAEHEAQARAKLAGLFGDEVMVRWRTGGPFVRYGRRKATDFVPLTPPAGPG
jgi:phenylacetate-CoA ligase